MFDINEWQFMKYFQLNFYTLWFPAINLLSS